MKKKDVILAFLENEVGMFEEGMIKSIFLEKMHISFVKGFSNEQNTILLDIKPDETATAESIKGYNLFVFSQTDFVFALSSIVTSGIGLTESSTKGLVLTTTSLLTFVFNFMQNIRKKFTEIEAEVLASIYTLKKPSNILEIKEKYEALFSKKVEDANLEIAINVLVEYKTIAYDASSELITLIEKITIQRK